MCMLTKLLILFQSYFRKLCHRFCMWFMVVRVLYGTVARSLWFWKVSKWPIWVSLAILMKPQGLLISKANLLTERGPISGDPQHLIRVGSLAKYNLKLSMAVYLHIINIYDWPHPWYHSSSPTTRRTMTSATIKVTNMNKNRPDCIYGLSRNTMTCPAGPLL